MNVPGLRSPYDKVGGIVYFGRMLDKIRLKANGSLPPDYVANLGEAFDGICVRFLGVSYADVVAETGRKSSDEAVLEWCLSAGRRPTEDDIRMWNDFMRKRGWNDDASERLKQRKAESGFTARDEIQTLFDYIDADEGRPLRARA